MNFHLVLGLAVLLGKTLSIPLAANPPGFCTYGGQSYRVGEEFNAGPCRRCECIREGRYICAISNCARARCVDPVLGPMGCCFICPNGSNCRAPDRTLIAMGDIRTLSNGTVCQCVSSSYTRRVELEAYCHDP